MSEELREKMKERKREREKKERMIFLRNREIIQELKSKKVWRNDRNKVTEKWRKKVRERMKERKRKGVTIINRQINEQWT